MALLHFFWEGKERTVSVHRQEKGHLHLYFLDPEIIDKVGATLILTGYKTNWQLKRTQDIRDEKMALDLLSSFREIWITPSV